MKHFNAWHFASLLFVSINSSKLCSLYKRETRIETFQRSSESKLAEELARKDYRILEGFMKVTALERESKLITILQFLEFGNLKEAENLILTAPKSALIYEVFNWCAARGNLEMIRFLVENAQLLLIYGVSGTKESIFKRALVDTTTGGHFDLLKYLIESVSVSRFFRAVEYKRTIESCISQAELKKFREIIEYLSEINSQLNITGTSIICLNKHKFSAEAKIVFLKKLLDLSIAAGNQAILKYLIKDVSISKYMKPLDYRNLIRESLESCKPVPCQLLQNAYGEVFFSGSIDQKVLRLLSHFLSSSSNLRGTFDERVTEVDNQDIDTDTFLNRN